MSESLQVEPVALGRAGWWEMLFFIKKLEPKQQQEVNSILQKSLDDQVRSTYSRRNAGKLSLWSLNQL